MRVFCLLLLALASASLVVVHHNQYTLDALITSPKLFFAESKLV